MADGLSTWTLNLSPAMYSLYIIDPFISILYIGNNATSTSQVLYTHLAYRHSTNNSYLIRNTYQTTGSK